MYKKRNVKMYISMLVLLCISGCAYKFDSFPFSMPKDRIVVIEFVEAKDEINYNVLCRLHDEIIPRFLDDLQCLEFRKTHSRMDSFTYGISIRIVYEDNSYDIFDFYCMTYVRQYKNYIATKVLNVECDKNAYFDLVNKYYEKGE